MRTCVPSGRLCTRGPKVALALVAGALLVGAATLAAAQTPSTPFVPYFGKNNIHYDNFAWHI